EWVHGIAPGARIVVLASPVSETEGVDGMPEFLALERYAVDNRLGSVISQSWGTSENLLDDADGAAMRSDFDTFYQQAGGKGITVVTASGDHGPLADTLSGGVATVRSADWPAGVPWITVVGGTMLRLNPNGSYGSETVLDSSSVASGSGISIFYDQPAEQSVLPPSFQKLLNGQTRRGRRRRSRRRSASLFRRDSRPRRAPGGLRWYERLRADLGRHRRSGEPGSGQGTRQHQPRALSARFLGQMLPRRDPGNQSISQRPRRARTCGMGLPHGLGLARRGMSGAGARRSDERKLSPCRGC
ncbi:MAG TPA: hypothetical protein VIO16_00845, partial [Dehalococcoidia bacterium]